MKPRNENESAYPYARGDKVRFQPSDRTRGFCIFHEKYGPKINHVYKIDSVDELGNLFFENGFGPFRPLDVCFAGDDAPEETPIPFPPLRELLIENDVAIPDISKGDLVVYLAEWANPESALALGFPVKGHSYRVEKVDRERLTLKLEGFEMAFSFWHFKKRNGPTGSEK